MDIITDEVWESYNHFISKSRISCYKFCPLQFRKKYVEGHESPQSYAMITGTRFHNFADTFFEVAPLCKPETWKQFIHPDFCPYERRMLDFFIDFEWDRLRLVDNDINRWMPLAREVKVINEEYGIRGILDRVDLIGNKILIVEYKTSKSIYKPSLQKEFGFYRLLLKNHPIYGDYDIAGGMVINPRVREVQIMNPSRETTILRDLDKIKEAIRTDNFPPACTGAKYAMCHMCANLEEANLYQCDPNAKPTWD